jgi:hypothetical protein
MALEGIEKRSRWQRGCRRPGGLYPPFDWAWSDMSKILVDVLVSLSPASAAWTSLPSQRGCPRGMEFERRALSQR